jgi:hypothetical protein
LGCESFLPACLDLAVLSVFACAAKLTGKKATADIQTLRTSVSATGRLRLKLIFCLQNGTLLTDLAQMGQPLEI